MIYNVHGDTCNAYEASGNVYTAYADTYQASINSARDLWKSQHLQMAKVYYKNGSVNDLGRKEIIPIVLHTDQHDTLKAENALSNALFTHLGLAIDWEKTSACIGLGDVDLAKSAYASMDTVLSSIPRAKRIDIWGNHDLWNNSTTVDGQFVVDWDTVYPYFNNENYGDDSHAYNHHGIEYHIDAKRNIKYICIAGWEIDTAKGGNSHYVIGQSSMASIVEMLEEQDGYDVIILCHTCPYANNANKYTLAGSDDSIIAPTTTDSEINQPVVHVLECQLDNMLKARNDKTSGTITDSYGNVHSYDFTNTTGNIICVLMGHYHTDAYQYSTDGVLSVDYDAFAYGKRPFYLINIDRTGGMIYNWKILSDGTVYDYAIPIKEARN